MNVTIKTPDEIAKMRIAGRLAANILLMIEEHIKPGISTNQLNDICHQYTLDHDAKSAPLFYPSYDPTDTTAFPKSICTSVNKVVCHGIPNDKPLKEGDTVNIDITVIKDGYHGDTSAMFHVGEITPANKKLTEVTQQCLYAAIDIVKPGMQLGEIGACIQKIADKNHYSIVQEYCGHGIGAVFHEEPQVLHYDEAKTKLGKKSKNYSLILKEGMTFTIEPMLNLGKRDTKLNKKDHWTVTTKDGRNSAQWEHTLAVTETGVEVLTARAGEPYFNG
ncbi:MAG: type I methionyl aminopeptidase [Pseudomonadales bacterium]|nr:type I methionyl aminopeptidase [Pseudomonadales bacterium]